MERRMGDSPGSSCSRIPFLQARTAEQEPFCSSQSRGRQTVKFTLANFCTILYINKKPEEKQKEMNEYLIESRRTYWRQLREMDPKEVVPRALVSHEKTAAADGTGAYIVPCLGLEYWVYPDEEKVLLSQDGEEIEDPEFSFLFVHYLIHVRDVPFSGKWISEKELKGGSLFFNGPHALPAGPLAERFGFSMDSFNEACRKAGGMELKPAYGDAGYEFHLFPRVLLAVVLWAGDDEFPPRVSFLFDKALDGQFPLDVVLYMVNQIVTFLS